MKLIAKLILLFVVASASELNALQNNEANVDNIKLKNTVNCESCSGGKKFEFEIKSTSLDEGFSINIDSDMSKFREAKAVDSFYLIIGDLPYGGSVLFVVGVAERSIMSKIYAYDMVFSPDSKHLVFKQFYPRFLAAEYQKTVIRQLSFTKNNLDIKNVNPEIAGKVIYPQSLVGKDNALTNEGGQTVNLANNVIFGKNWVSFVFKNETNYVLNFTNIQKPGLTCSMPFSPVSLPGRKSELVHENTRIIDNKIYVDFFEVDGVAVGFKFNIGLICDGILYKK